MERRDRAPVATFYTTELPPNGGEVSLGGSAAHHAGVRRLSAGDVIRLTDGCGTYGVGTIRTLRKHELVLDVESVGRTPPLPQLEVLAPVADRERMLWLAEKCAELGISVWQPVIFARSRSVAPRGEGDAFAAKVRARMVAALEQSGGAWLPEVRLELPLADAVARTTAHTRYLLDRHGGPLDPALARDGAAVIFGPEGGIEPAEQVLLDSLGWRRARLASTTLRFETAGIGAVAVLRAGAVMNHVED
ncbi:MAG: 16S rRNA (uracil(1498)-N(3))-methyltransferase [Gemmatimonadaceae bacterium]